MRRAFLPAAAAARWAAACCCCLRVPPAGCPRQPSAPGTSCPALSLATAAISLANPLPPLRSLPFFPAVGALAKLNEQKPPMLFVVGEFDRLCPGARLKEAVAEVLPDCDARIVSLEVGWS